MNKKGLTGLLACLILIVTSVHVFSHSHDVFQKDASDLTPEAKKSEVDQLEFLQKQTGEAPEQGKPPFGQMLEQRKKSMGFLETFRLDWSALDLSPDQKAQVKKRRKEFMIQAAELREKLKSTRGELAETIVKRPINSEKVKEITNQVAEIESQLAQMALRNLLEIKKVLTSAQLEKLPILASGFLQRWKDLDLTSDQFKQLSETMQEFAKRRRETENKIQSFTTELKENLFQPATDQKQVEKLTQELVQAKKEQALLRAEFLIKSRSILTPSQLEKLSTKSELK